MGADMIFWYFGFQLGILVCFVILIFKVGEVKGIMMKKYFEKKFGEGTAFDLDYGKLLILALLIYIAFFK